MTPTLHTATPTFSIVVPTYQRPDLLSKCLQAIARLDYPRDRFEVIVVNDGSDSPLDTVIVPFRPELSISLVEQPNAGPAAARNTGAARAKAEFLAFTDDDCQPEPTWLRELGECLAQAPECMVGGSTVNAETARVCSVTSQLIVEVVYRHYNADPLRARFLAGNNMAVSTSRLREIGGFDAQFRTAEDRELCDRWLNGGRRIIYHPAARIRHTRPLTLGSFIRQHFEYGRGAARFHRERRRRRSGTMLAESRFHLDVNSWMWSPIRAVRPGQMLAVATLLATWQASNLAGFLWETLAQYGTTLGESAPSFSR